MRNPCEALRKYSFLRNKKKIKSIFSCYVKRNYGFKTSSFLLVYLYNVIFTIFFNRKWLGPRIFFLTVIRHVAKKNKALSQLPVKKSDKITPISGGIQAVRLQLVLICVKKVPVFEILTVMVKKYGKKT